MEDLFHKYNVDIYLCGHVHAVRAFELCHQSLVSRMNSAPQYERHYPIYQGKYIQSYNNPSGLTEVVIGCAGNIEGHENTWQDPIPGWCAYVEQMVAPVAAALVAAVRDLLRHVFTVFTTVTITATES